MSYAEIIVNQKSAKADKPYTYRIPEELAEIIEPGKRVVIPFGRFNKLEIGMVVSIEDSSSGDFKYKNILDVLDKNPLVDTNMIQLAYWMKKEYMCSFSEAIQTVLPPGDFREIKTYIKTSKLIDTGELSKLQRQILENISDGKAVIIDELKEKLDTVGLMTAIQDLEEKQLIELSFDIAQLGKGRTQKFVKPIMQYNEGLGIIGPRAPKQQLLWNEIWGSFEIPVSDLLQKCNTSLSVLKILEARSMVELIEKSIQESPIGMDIARYSKIELNSSQRRVYSSIESHPGEAFLIHGITGSGKTEIYLQLVEEMLSKGKDSIILVPEIALTPQTIDRFAGRFGNRVAILHSGLTQTERFDQWRRIKSGEYKIVVGARSAIFAPFNDLGLIVIDEEHENTYKSSINPKYSTYEVARKRCSMSGSTLVLGTATPSVETYYRALKGDLKLLEINTRATPMQLPEIQVVDMRKELSEGNRSIISRLLYEEMKTALGDGRQVIIFLNRRGYSGSIVCRSCGYVSKCDSCEVSMTYHKSNSRLRCHYCGSTKPTPILCPICGSSYIRGFGVGTEKVEEMLNKIFPGKVIVRMDSDAVRNKVDYERILTSMKQGEIDILIGTQMISKGLDFPNVTVVGIIAADITLNLPDFRSPERTFQLTTQVAGRAGRGEWVGKVILQTYNPEHYSIQFSRNSDYKGFYDEEIKLRKALKYPPFLRMGVITVFGKDNNRVKFAVEKWHLLLNGVIGDNNEVEILGPHPAPLEKINGNHRYQIVLKFGYNIQKQVADALDRVFIEDKERIRQNDIKVSIDLDPVSIL
jgi:primosomal protein N' (replication factor Y)